MQNYEPLNKCDYEEHLHFALSRISHEIRNPVTLINSSLQIIEAEHPEVKDFQFWDDVKGDLSYLLTLLNDLSSYNNGNSLTLECFKPGPWLKDPASQTSASEKAGTPLSVLPDPAGSSSHYCRPCEASAAAYQSGTQRFGSRMHQPDLFCLFRQWIS